MGAVLVVPMSMGSFEQCLCVYAGETTSLNPPGTTSICLYEIREGVQFKDLQPVSAIQVSGRNNREACFGRNRALPCE